MDAFWYFIIFIFGLFIGSFLNAIIYRLEQNKSFLKGRSFCPHCKHTLLWRDLVPLWSFFVLKGRCRYCKEKISFQYPFVELATGLLFLGIAKEQLPVIGYFDLISMVYLFTIASALIVIFVYDLKHFLIPDKVVYFAVAVALLAHWFGVSNSVFDSGFKISNFQYLVNPLVSAVIGSAFFLAIILISKGKWMGLGDAKLAFLMGLVLGFPNILVAFFFAFFVGAIIGLGLIALKQKTFKSEVPFGPFLTAGTLLALFFGERIVQWYVQLFFFGP